ncbi:hypothetical protein [Rubinisphaera margarita]|nr:hypothetical protein [Rubinisphaera margarita]MCG6158146.1 hypothetical protein [Rubinisphaera margarita]
MSQVDPIRDDLDQLPHHDRFQELLPSEQLLGLLVVILTLLLAIVLRSY